MNRKSEKFFLLIFIILLSTNLSQNRARQNDQTISCLQIPVRVFLQGKPVETLKKSDFQVFLNGQLQPIRQLKVVKRIMIPEPGRAQKPRLFMLLSNITNPNPRIQQYLEYLFDRVFEVNDRLILVFDTGIYRLDSLKHKQPARVKTKRLLLRHGVMLNKARKADAGRLEETIDYLRKNAESFSGNDAEFISGGKIHQHYYMKYFKSSLARYLKASKNYIRRYLLPDPNRYRELMADLNHFPGEKWLIHLFQPGKTPRLSKKNRSAIKKMISNLTQRDWTVAWMDEIDNAKQIKKLLADIDETLKIASQFPAKELTDLLFTYSWTLNSICFSHGTNGHSANRDSYQSNLEIKKSWQQVSHVTGGCFIDQPASLPDSLLGVNDTNYLILLNPRSADQAKKVEIKLPYPDHQIVYPDEIRPVLSRISDPEIDSETWRPAVSNVEVKKNKLSIKISNLSQEKGKIKVHVEITDDQNRLLFDEKKILNTDKDVVGITLNIDWLNREKHTVIVEVTDLSTSRSDIQIFQPH